MRTKLFADYFGLLEDNPARVVVSVSVTKFDELWRDDAADSRVG